MANATPPTPPLPPAQVTSVQVPGVPAEAPPRHRLNRPSLVDLFWQAYRDLVGKDVQQSTTYSYVWSADQAGHVLLGFLPTFVVYWLGVSIGWEWAIGGCGMLYAGLGVMAVWVALELFDFVQSSVRIRRSTGYFRGNYLNLAWNVVTALLYFCIGAVVAAASSLEFLGDASPATTGLAKELAAVGLKPRTGNSYAFVLWTILVIALLQLLVAVWWLRQKVVFQQAGLPFLYRLPNYDGRFDLNAGQTLADVVTAINAMRAPPLDRLRTEARATDRRHLIVCGPPSSGKTSLGVGIGTEFAFVRGIGRYITMSNLAQHIASRAAAELRHEPDRSQPRAKLPTAQSSYADPARHEFNDGRILWQWPSVDLLVIDDVIELLLPVRRQIEERLKGNELTAEVEKLVLGDPKLVQELGGEQAARDLLARMIPPVQQRLQDLARPEMIARYVASTFREVIDQIKLIPRVVWVLGDMILPHLFEKFVRDTFGFQQGEPGEANLQVIHLQPPEQAAAPWRAKVELPRFPEVGGGAVAGS